MSDVKFSCSEKLGESTLMRSYFSLWLMSPTKSVDQNGQVHSLPWEIEHWFPCLFKVSSDRISTFWTFLTSFTSVLTSVYFSFYILSLENCLHFLSLIPSFPVAAKPRGLSGAACVPGSGGAYFGRPSSTAATGGGDHQQPAPCQPGLQHPADSPFGPPETL